MAHRLFELYGHEANMKLLAKELTPLQGIGSQTCITFSVDGSKFAAGDKSLTAVWDMSSWNKIGHKRLLRKSASVMSVSHDGKYLSLGSKDGDICVVEVKKMQIHHYSKRLHLGTTIATLEFCPSER
ncbi:hypothetical protein TSUD_140330 [Trifolium subterraneum]|uniref:Anaphase-promoting complex subunit 4 WD40 domain-containing protein n=1 Tax=Trifolium subterraneum TaxID=3900 RepID=A0A2Z6PI28_TRISU|nr:hypothetical protein TSUD_140330 [Trifolium subterraneum]